MARAGDIGKKRSGAAAMLLAGAVGLLALPSAVLAFSTSLDLQPGGSQTDIVSSTFRPAEVNPRLARSITVRALGKGRTFQFTPAASPSPMERSVTVAVRMDSHSARTIVVRGLANANSATGSGLAIASTAYSLGAARSYKGLEQGSLGPDIRKIAMPDLSAYRPSAGPPGAPSRLSPRIVLDEREKLGRSPRTFETQEDQTVDLGGSYRLSRNLNVTAGVRYSSERDRLVPLADGKQDNQAVYVGTQFKF